MTETYKTHKSHKSHKSHDSQKTNALTAKSKLHNAAEARLAKMPDNASALTPQATQQTLHELRVHQIELEMQNEELRRAQEELAVSRARYVDLYDMAPVGYLTVSKAGQVLQANLTAATLLGVARGKLVKRPFSRFILKDDQDVFYLNRKQLFATGAALACELRMVKPGGTPFRARLEATTAPDEDSTPVCHIMLSDITGQKQAEQALLESEQEYRTLFNNAGDAIFIADPAMRMLAVNPMACVRLGYARAELMALSIKQIDSEADALLVPERMARLRKHGHLTFETTHRRKDGSSILVEVNARLITWHGQPAIMSLCRDISERRLMDQTLREWNQILEQRVTERTLDLRRSEARFSQLAAVTLDGIAISADGLLLDGNPQLASLFGYELAEMTGRPVADFLTRGPRRLASRDAAGITHEWLGLRKDGTTFPVALQSRVKTFQGRKMRVAALRDLSAVKQQAARIQTQQTELEQALRFALASEVSTGIIHQLGQPTMVIGTNVAVALANSKACECQPCGAFESLKDIEAGVASMREIVSHLRALAHPERPNRVRTDCNDLVAGLLRPLRQEAKNRRILLSVRSGRDLPPVLADVVQLGQVILNLARNAFDACADCPPERRKVTLMTRALAGEGVELSVCDAGTGIAPEAMNCLFTPFFTTKPDGLGIGLRLCQTIVEAHGGTLGGSNNADGIGATFRVVLPAIPE